MTLRPFFPAKQPARVLVLLLFAFLQCSTFAAETKEAPPDDLEIYLASEPRLPGAVPGPYSVTIDAEGEAQLSSAQTPEGELPATTVQLPDKAMRDIWHWIRKERFFELDPLYSDPEVADGDFAEMRITANGTTHTVRTVNIRVFAFDRIAVVIGHYLPEGRRVQYNALHVPGYESVER